MTTVMPGLLALAFFACLFILRGFLVVAADIWNGLKAGLRAMAGLDEKRLRDYLPPPARAPRDPRQGLDPDDPANTHLLEICPVCDMKDAERFELGVGVAKWRGWPAHDSCVAWLGPGETALAESTITDGFEIRRAPSWSVEPARGMAVIVTAALAGTSRHALVLLQAASPVRARIDAVCWLPASGELTVVHGTPSPLPYAAMIPAGAEVIAWLTIPAACVQVYPAMIRCALPSELPGLR